MRSDADEIDELLERARCALRRGELDQWERRFVLSLLGRAKRGGPSWRPSPKQAAALRRLIEPARPAPLIEPATPQPKGPC